MIERGDLPGLFSWLVLLYGGGGMYLFGLICWGNWEYPANEAGGVYLKGFEYMVIACIVIGLVYYTLQQLDGMHYEGRLFQSG